MYFSSNTPNIIKDWTNRILAVKEVEQFEKYLGLLKLIERVKYQTFSISKIGFGKNFKVGKASCYLKLKKKC